jgi:hypothetical protein
MSQKLLTPDHFRKPFYGDRLKAEAQIGKVLNKALRDFRNNKILPCLPNLRAAITTIALAFTPIDIDESGRLIKGVNIDETPAGQMSEWADKHRGEAGFTDVCETLSWAWPHVCNVTREGLAVREAVKDQSKLLDLSSDVLAESGLLIVDEFASNRSYGYRYKVVEASSKQVELSGELGCNFPRMKGGAEIRVESRNSCLEEKDLWRDVPNAERRKEFRDSILRVAPMPNHSVFHFWCSMPFPLEETLIPVAREELQRHLQGNLGQTKMF